MPPAFWAVAVWVIPERCFCAERTIVTEVARSWQVDE
jgi:hypothetical protein